MTVYVILAWDGNTWKLEGNGFVSKRKAENYCKYNSALMYQGIDDVIKCESISVDVNCD